MSCQISPMFCIKLGSTLYCLHHLFTKLFAFCAVLIVMHYYCPPDSSRSLTEHLNDEYHHYMLQAEIFHEALSCLPFPGTQSNIFLVLFDILMI